MSLRQGWSLILIGLGCWSCASSPATEAAEVALAGPVKPPASAPADEPTANPALLLSASSPLAIEALPWQPRPAVEKVQQADRALVQSQPTAALAALAQGSSPPAALLRARAQRLLGQLDEAERGLTEAERDQTLTLLAKLERAFIAAARKDEAAAATLLLPLALGDDRAVAAQAVMPLLAVLPGANPEAMLTHAAQLEPRLPGDEPDARSLWLAAQAQAADKLGRADPARGLRLRQWLEEPVSLQTPEEPPLGTAPSTDDLLDRAQRLLDAHRSERVLALLERLPVEKLTTEQRCRHAFSQGVAERKLRLYAKAEQTLWRATQQCSDVDLIRRAAYLHLKVVSIRDGLRALPFADAFAKTHAGHSMVDDVLFWAGDILQRRSRYAEAQKYYQAITTLPEKGDHCAEAAWRLAWMAQRQGQKSTARTLLTEILADTACTPARADRARAAYWLGRLAPKGEPAEATGWYEKAVEIEALGYYSQSALSRLAAYAPEKAAASSPSAPAKTAKRPNLCPGFLAQEPSFRRGLELLVRGLGSDAAASFRAVPIPEQRVLGSAHATNLGLEARPAKAAPFVEGELESCGPHAPLLLLTLLLDEAGAHREAHWRLRTEFSELLSRPPTPSTAALWFAAYPLAFREPIAAAEKEAGLPDLFLQSLCREESALDPKAVSWAGAYGLSQLLLSSARGAGKLVDPPVIVNQAEELLEPTLSARLGGMLLGSQVRKLRGHLGLALAAYNAGDDVAVGWWRRFAGQPFDVYGEEMTIKETRGYVKRVLQTYGIYRWLYAGEPVRLPVAETMPAR